MKNKHLFMLVIGSILLSLTLTACGPSAPTLSSDNCPISYSTTHRSTNSTSCQLPDRQVC